MTRAAIPMPASCWCSTIGIPARATRCARSRPCCRRSHAAVVVGVEHVAAGDAATLAAYRDATGMPVFGVDLRRAGDRALLAEAIIGVRVLAELHRRWQLPA